MEYSISWDSSGHRAMNGRRSVRPKTLRIIVIGRFHTCVEREAVPCPRCVDGTAADGSACPGCGGRAELDVADLVDDRTFDDEAFDRWRDERDFAGVAA
jgi:hypothetical protein